MGTLGGEFDAGDVGTEDRMRRKTILIDSGANCTAATKTAGKTYMPSSSNGSFTQDIPAFVHPSDATTVENFAVVSGTQTFTNKTLTSPTITSPTVSNGTFSAPDISNPKFMFVTRAQFALPPILAMYSSGGTGTETITQGTNEIVLNTDSNTGDDAYITLYNTNAPSTRGDTAFELSFTVSVNATASQEIEVGVTNNAAPSALMTSAANHITIVYDASTSANWIARNANGTSQTSTTSSTAVTTGIHYFTIINLESSVLFYVDGTLLATHSTNLPTTTVMSPLTIFDQTETTAGKAIKYQGGMLVYDIA